MQHLLGLAQQAVSKAYGVKALAQARRASDEPRLRRGIPEVLSSWTEEGEEEEEALQTELIHGEDVALDESFTFSADSDRDRLWSPECR